MLYQLLSKLLDYPDPALMEAIPEIRARLARDPGVDAGERRAVEGFLDHLAASPLIDAQAAYVQTFDLTPAHALHLTHHLFGEDKNRGPALIDLTEFYREFGFEVDAGAGNELPDYLPLVLEFAACLEVEEARLFLAQWLKVLRQLAANLEEAKSPYAPLVRLAEARSQLVKAAA